MKAQVETKELVTLSLSTIRGVAAEKFLANSSHIFNYQRLPPFLNKDEDIDEPLQLAQYHHCIPSGGSDIIVGPRWRDRGQSGTKREGRRRKLR
jgi:hypothetical protein